MSQRMKLPSLSQI